MQKKRTFIAIDIDGRRYRIDEYIERIGQQIRIRYQLGKDIVAKVEGNFFRLLDGTLIRKL